MRGVDPGAKITALQPLPTGLTSIRNPLYSTMVIACVTSTTSPTDFARALQFDAHNSMSQNEKGRPGCCWHGVIVKCSTLAEMRAQMRTPVKIFS